MKREEVEKYITENKLKGYSEEVKRAIRNFYRAKCKYLKNGKYKYYHADFYWGIGKNELEICYTKLQIAIEYIKHIFKCGIPLKMYVKKFEYNL